MEIYKESIVRESNALKSKAEKIFKIAIDKSIKTKAGIYLELREGHLCLTVTPDKEVYDNFILRDHEGVDLNAHNGYSDDFKYGLIMKDHLKADNYITVLKSLK